MKSRTANKVTSEKTAAIYDEVVLKNYGSPPFALVKGEGSYLWDAENRRYLDFCTGIAVNTLGHCHSKWTDAIKAQLDKLVHVSNLYAIPEQAELAQRIIERVGKGKAFFCNSGAEANEFLIKLARLWGVRKSGGESGKIFKIVTAENSFHGRTFGGMSATPQEKIQKGFAPLVPGFVHAKFNDVDSFAEAIDEKTAAVMIETIQGEGGIHPATKAFLQGLRELCDEKKILLLIDEVQCGIGRSGKFFAFEHFGVIPDAIGMAKGLGNGFPIGANWVADKFADLFTPGSHGTTFGGSPLACAAANAVINAIEEESLLEQVSEFSKSWHEGLKAICDKHSDKISGFRGMGYHVALAMKTDPLPWMKKLRENGLLTVRGGTDAIRLMPPLNVSKQDLDTSLEIIDFTIGTTEQ